MHVQHNISIAKAIDLLVALDFASKFTIVLLNPISQLKLTLLSEITPLRNRTEKF